MLLVGAEGSDLPAGKREGRDKGFPFDTTGPSGLASSAHRPAGRVGAALTRVLSVGSLAAPGMVGEWRGECGGSLMLERRKSRSCY